MSGLAHDKEACARTRAGVFCHACQGCLCMVDPSCATHAAKPVPPPEPSVPSGQPAERD